MNLPLDPEQERERLAALRSYQILDTAPDEAFDRLARLASLLCDTPVALVSLVDADRQWYKARYGMDATETPREGSFCDHAIRQSSLFEVTDAQKDERFRSTPRVLGPPFNRFYAGYPLLDPQGQALGTLCVIDRKPRQLGRDQALALELLAQEVVAQIVAQQRNRELHSLEQLFLFSSDLIGLLGTDGQFWKINPSFERILGWSEAEFMAAGPGELVLAEDRQATLALQRSMATGPVPGHFSNRLRTKAGGFRYIDWVLKADPATGNTYAIGRDVTEQRQIAADMALAHELAQSANKAKSEFLATMSHEIRTPLNGVIGFTDILMRTPLDETQQQFLGVIHQSANSLLDIVSDILDFSKIEEGKLDLDLHENDLHETASQVVDAISFQASQKRLEVLLDLDPRLPLRAVFDSVRLRQVLVNLLGNAVKFTEAGEIELAIQLLPDRTVKFSVRDTGIGIKPQYQRRIFEAFTQEDTSTTRRFGGTGLGLAISNRLLALMGSSLALESTPDVGTTFSFVLKLELLTDLPPPPATRWDSAEVLLVDDNAGTRRLLKRLLEAVGLDCFEAATVQEADAFLGSRTFRVVLLDQQMTPLGKLDQLAVLPVVLLVGPLDKDSPPEASALHRLVKPVKAKELLLVLEKILGKPLQVLVPNTESPASNSLAAKGSGLHILIADDNSLNVFLARTVLGLLLPGCQIVEVPNGKDAVEQFVEHQPDLILMDVQMPVLTGLEATRKIRELEAVSGKRTRVPIIALTAGAVTSEREACLASGMDDYLSKPFVKEDLAAALRRHLHSTGKS